MIICKECGFSYSNTQPFCPECGNPTPQDVTRFVNNTGLQNCPNCGAPITNNISCEYCDTVFLHNNAIATENRNNNQTGNDKNGTQQNNSAGEVGAAAFLGGLIGGLVD